MKTTIVDKLHLIRKITSLIQLFLCIVVFAFGLIVLIIGCVALATANADLDTFFTTSDVVSGANLLITAGIFSFIIVIIGLAGSIPGLFDRQDNWNLWVALFSNSIYLVILAMVIIFEIAAGAWAYAKWDYVSTVLIEEIAEEVGQYYGLNGYSSLTEKVDSFQLENQCCGFDHFTDWKYSAWRKMNNRSNNYQLPLSCCNINMYTTPVASTTPMTTMAAISTTMTNNSTNTTIITITNSTTTTTPTPGINCERCSIPDKCIPQMSSTSVISTTSVTSTSSETNMNTTTSVNNTNTTTTTTPTPTTTTITPITNITTTPTTVVTTTTTLSSSSSPASTCPTVQACTCNECTVTNKNPCNDAIEQEIRDYTLGIAGVGIAFGIMELIIMLVPICLIIVICIELRRSQSMKVQ